MIATVVTNNDELKQIVQLSQKNLRTNITHNEQDKEGFVTWSYSFELLEKMNAQHPHVIVKDNDAVIGYALVALRESSAFHTELNAMILQLDDLIYNNKKLSDHKYYVMGQVCIDHAYRGKGVFEMLYLHHKKIFEKKYDFLITEISTENKRSLRAHEKVGFKTIYTYRDSIDEWSVVLWDWQ